jgi:hypothetical protein
MLRIKTFITLGLAALILSLGACEEEKEPEYQSIYKSDLEIEKLYDNINKAENTWVTDFKIIRDTGEFGGILYDKNDYVLNEPPAPEIGVRVKGESTFLDATDGVELFAPLELVVTSTPPQDVASKEPYKFRIDRLKVVISRPGLIPLEKEYAYGELLARLNVQKQEQGEYIYTIDPFDLSYNPSGSMIHVYVKGLSRIDPEGDRIALNVDSLPKNEFAYRLIP